jgi:hypothetical protein
MLHRLSPFSAKFCRILADLDGLLRWSSLVRKPEAVVASVRRRPASWREHSTHDRATDKKRTATGADHPACIVRVRARDGDSRERRSLGIHGAIVLLAGIAGAFASSPATTSRSRATTGWTVISIDPSRMGIILAMIWVVAGLFVGDWIAWQLVIRT